MVLAPPNLIESSPPEGGWSGHPLFSLENIYRAYLKCRRRKRGTHNALRFEQRLEDNLVALHRELEDGTYRPGRFLAFLLDKPKRREIFAADFRDRVVHHVLVGHLEPDWERRFIHDSFACRKGKGTLAGVERLRSFTRKTTANGTRRAFYLQLDIRSFFMALDRRVLWQRLASKDRDPAVLWLMHLILFQDPTANCRLRGARQADFDRLPQQKSLFQAPPERGLPIGNLTSQFWANVYLDALDQFVKHGLKARYYVRYCDDMVLLSTSRNELAAWQARIEGFLRDELHLEVNDRTKLRPVSDGIDFLGYIVRPDYLLVRRRVVGNLRERLQQAETSLLRAGMTVAVNSRSVFPWPWPILFEVRQWLNSYLGYLRNASTHRLVARLRERHAWLTEYFDWRGWKVEFRCPVPRFALRFHEQVGHFQEQLPGHLLMIQKGASWEVVMPRSIAARAPAGTLPVVDGQRIRRSSPGSAVERRLWQSRIPVAWIGETGRRLTDIAERALVCRWAGAGQGRLRRGEELVSDRLFNLILREAVVVSEFG